MPSSRRSFLRLSALGCAAAMVGKPSSGLEPEVSPAAGVGDFELAEVGVVELRRRMESGELSAREIAALYIERIEAHDSLLSSVLEINPDALEIAGALDRERAAGRVRGPLHGIPVLLKDNVDTADRMTTTAGSLALEGSIPSRDSFVAKALREGGAVVLGKTNLSEWANFRSSRSSSGWSARGGQCRNPFVLDRSPCGSSSGSGAAVSASFSTVAIGTETNGSVVCPSSANGVVGIKPTVGLVSRSGIIPIAHSQDTAGPMARTVADAAAVLGVIGGVDPEDSATIGHSGPVHADYTRFLDAGSLRGARLGVARSFFGFHADVDRVLEDALQALREAGAVLVDPIDLEVSTGLRDSSYEVLLYEFKADVAAYLAKLGPGVAARDLADLIRFNEENRDREMPYFGQEVFLEAQQRGPLSSPEYVAALETSRRLSRTEGIDRVVSEQRLDAIVAPTGGPAWVIDLVNGDHFGGSSSTPAAVAGYPNITVPAGFIHGLPVGLSFFGRPFSEGRLIGLGYAFEQETQHRRAPLFRPSVDSVG